MEPLVSVIIPAYNVQQYVEDCLNSVINQTYKNLQIIVVNDGSTDNTYSICQKIAKKDSRIELYSKSNGGLSSARNFGINKLKGKFTVLVDSDDYVDEKMVEKLVANALDSDCNIVMCNAYSVDEAGALISKNNQDTILENGIWSRKDFWEHLYNGSWGNCTVPWNKLYKSDLFKKALYPEGKLNEDDFILYDLISQVSAIKVITDYLYYHRIRAKSIMSSKKGDDVRYLDGVEASVKRLWKAYQNNELYLVAYTLKSIPNLFIHQYNCRRSKRYRNLKRNYRNIVKTVCNNTHISKKILLLNWLFFNAQYIYYYLLRLKDTLD